jgi:TatD DNase family protein
MIDFHCHIDLYPDPKWIVANCELREITVLSVTTTPSAWHGTSSLVQDNDNIKTALGLHPQIAHERYRELDLFDQIFPCVDFIGEIGLDGSSEFKPYWSKQIIVFEHILERCQSGGGRIMSIHSRGASAPVLEMLETFSGAGKPILHWFSGSLRELQRAIDIDCWFSVGPAMLRSEKGRTLVSRMPRKKIITESDGPFAQVQGCSLFPWDVETAISMISKIWNVTHNQCSQLIKENLLDLKSTMD